LSLRKKEKPVPFVFCKNKGMGSVSVGTAVWRCMPVLASRYILQPNCISEDPVTLNWNSGAHKCKYVTTAISELNEMRRKGCGFYTGFIKQTEVFLEGLQIYLSCFDAFRNTTRTAAWRGLLKVMAIAKIIRV
jgi:hypothetical protein